MIHAVRAGLFQRIERHAELRALHAQIAQLCKQFPLKFRGDRPAGLRQLRTQIVQDSILFLQKLFQVRNPLFAVLYGIELRLRVLPEGDYLFHRRAVFSLQARDRFQTMTDLVHQARIEGQFFIQALQLLPRHLRSVIHVHQFVCQLFKPQIERGDIVHRIRRAAQRFLRAGFASAAVGQAVRRFHAGTDFFGVFQHAQPVFQLLFLARLQMRGCNFLHLKGEHIDHPFALGGLAQQALQFANGFGALCVRVRYARLQRAMVRIAERIDKFNVHRRIHQALVFVLPVQIHKARCKLLQHRQRQHRACDAAYVLAVSAQFAHHGNQPVVRFQSKLLRHAARIFIV